MFFKSLECFYKGDIDLAFFHYGVWYQAYSSFALYIPLFGYGPIDSFGFDHPILFPFHQKPFLRTTYFVQRTYADDLTVDNDFTDSLFEGNL